MTPDEYRFLAAIDEILTNHDERPMSLAEEDWAIDRYRYDNAAPEDIVQQLVGDRDY